MPEVQLKHLSNATSGIPMPEVPLRHPSNRTANFGPGANSPPSDEMHPIIEDHTNENEWATT